MSDSVVTSIIIGAFGFLMVTLFTIVAFFVVRWIKGLDSTLKRLNETLETVLRDVDRHEQMFANGYHQGGGCSTAGCPFYDSDKTPIPRLAHTRMGDKKE